MRDELYTGYTFSESEKQWRTSRRNWQHACWTEIGYPVDEDDADYLAAVVDICNTDPRHVLNTAQAVDDWMQRDGAAATYGNADPRTMAQRWADEDWLDEQNTREAVRP